MEAKFLGGPCDGHVHDVDADDLPERRPPGCRLFAAARGYYRRVEAPAGADLGENVVYYRWTAPRAGADD